VGGCRINIAGTLLVTACLVGVGANASGAAPYRLTEYLGHSWQDELICFPVEFHPGECRRIVRVTADGKAVHFQVPSAELSQRPDGSIASAKVYIITDLAPKQEITFGVVSDKNHVKLAAVLPATDLRITEGDELVTIETASAGVRLPLGRFNGPGRIPAPYQGFRLTTGRWVGTSRLMGDPAPQGLKAELVERGPLFAEVLLTYSYPEGRTYVLRCRVIAGQPVALFSEEFDIEPGCKYHRNINYDYRRFAQGRFGYSGAFQDSHWVRLSLGDFSPDLTKLVSSPDLGSHAAFRADDPWLATLHPWQSWHGGSMMVPLADEREYLALMALKAGHWVRPLENLALVKRDGEEIYLELPINDGAREWGVHFGLPDSWKPTGPERNPREYPGLDHPSPLRLALIKYGESPLDVIKDWQLRWKDRAKVPYPVSINPPGELETVRKRIAEEPLLSRHAQGVTEHWESLRGQENFPLTRLWVMTPDGVEDVYLATGEERHARELYELTLARLHYYVEQTLRGVGFHNYRAGHQYGMFHLAHVLVGVARQADLCLGSPFLSDEQKANVRAHLAFFAYLFDDGNYWPPNNIGKGTYNMYASRDGALGILGSLLAGHPQAPRWQKAADDRINDILDNFIYPSGAMLEGMHYSGVTLDFTLPYMMLLKLSGGKDYFTDERLKRGLRWYASCLPPVDKRFGRAYMPPFGYSHNSNTSQSVRWAVAAAMTAQTDPEFCGLMMRTWQQQGWFMKMVGGEAGYQSAFFVGVVDPSLPVPDDPALASAKWEGFGAVLRNHSDSPLETFMAIPTGVPGGFRAYPNEGTFHLYAKGAPLCLRFGTRSFNAIATLQAWMNNRITFDRRDECHHGTGKIISWASLGASDLFGGEYRFTRLAAKAPMTGEEPGRMELSEPRVVKTDQKVGEGLGFFGDQEDVPPQLWRRFIMFVKDPEPLGPNYFLVRDRFQASLPTDWNLWCLAEELKIDGARATFKGKFDVDLDVFIAQEPKKIVSGAWGPDWERQKLLQLQQDPNVGYFALLYPRKRGEPVPEFTALAEGKGVRVTLPGRTDWAFLCEDSVEVKEDDVEFSGRAGMVRREEGRQQLVILHGDRIAVGDFALMHGRQVVEDVRVPAEGPIAVSAALEPGPRLVGEYEGGARKVVIRVPVAYRSLRSLKINGRPADLMPEGVGVYSFRLPGGRGGFEINP